jgi:polysaccharide export outer membrane protein
MDGSREISCATWFACVLSAGAMVGCASLGSYVWVDQVKTTDATRERPAYILAPGDVLFVRVFSQDNISGKSRVRPDGFITVPFLNDVPVAGKTTTEVALALEGLLKKFINQPVVTVSLEEPRPFHVSVLGEVSKPGIYPLDPRASSVLGAVALAGGLTVFAHSDRIFVVRPGAEKKIRFSFEALSNPASAAARFTLVDGDLIIVQ